jgi:N-acetylmuramoyl-L-alanine amidase
MIQGKSVAPDVPPLIKNGRTLVPIRVVAEGLGARVGWEQSTRTATIERGNNKLILQVNSAKAIVNGREVKLDAPPTMQNQRMLLPLRFVGETLGLNVGWDNQTRTVLANQAISLEVNGQAVKNAPKFYLYADQLYAPIDEVAKLIGWKKTFSANQLHKAKTIDSQLMVAIDELEEMIGGDVDWDRDENRVTIERLSRFAGYSVEGQKIFIETTKRISPEHFLLDGPYRLVLDLPQTVLSDEMLERLTQERKAEPAEASADAADGQSDGSRDGANQSGAADWEETYHTEGSHDPADKAVGEKAGEAENDGGETGAARASDQSAEPPLISSIRYSQYSSNPQTVRVVIELSQKSKYSVVEKDNGIEIAFTPVPRKTGFLIVVDAGHGGKDQGAKGVTGNLEKDFNLAVANRVVELLKQYPEFQVVATRTTDVYLTLQERVNIANERDADLFLSIHANSFKPSARGTETYYYNANSEKFARVVHRHLLAATGFPDRKVQTAPFYVIKHTKMPAVLTETGFLSNAIENAQLTSPAFREKVAKALVAAIREYYLSYQ